MPGAIMVRKIGGPDVMTYEDVRTPAPKPGEVTIRHHASGVNFVDTYYRTGLYAAPGGLPFVLGAEGAGEVTGLGEGVDAFAVGDRVAYSGSVGSYAQERTYPAERLVKLPDAISYEQAAGMMLKGMTTQYLIRRTFRVGAGMSSLSMRLRAASGCCSANGRSRWAPS